MKTLLIIDMQNAWLANPQAPCFDTEQVINRINHAAQKIRQDGGKVIFIRHSDNDASIGSAGWQVLSTLQQTDADVFIEKLHCDSFIATDLAAKLAEFGCKSLYISGFATEFCIDTTIRSAAGLGFEVVALSDAHTTADRPHLRAENIIQHHNWVWADMSVPSKQKIQVKTVAELFTNG